MNCGHSLKIFRWEEMEQCSWYLRRCQRDTTGHLLPSQQWWRREDSPETSQMDCRATTTGCICCNGSSYSPIQKRAWHPIPSCHHFLQGRWLWALGCLASVCWGGCQLHLSLWQGMNCENRSQNAIFWNWKPFLNELLVVTGSPIKTTFFTS